MLADLLNATALGGSDGWACAPWLVAAGIGLTIMVGLVLHSMRVAERDMRDREER